MAQDFNFKCDSCKAIGQARYNREHYLPPKGWVNVEDTDTRYLLGHLCQDCAEVALNFALSTAYKGRLARFRKRRAKEEQR